MPYFEQKITTGDRYICEAVFFAILTEGAAQEAIQEDFFLIWSVAVVLEVHRR